jgi:hypothetical protein
MHLPQPPLMPLEPPFSPEDPSPCRGIGDVPEGLEELQPLLEPYRSRGGGRIQPAILRDLP